MRDHMAQTEQDMDTYVRDPGEAILAIRAGEPPDSTSRIARRRAKRPPPTTDPKDTR